MVTKAIARYVRVSPRKTRKVIDLIRGLPVVKAEAILDVISKRPRLYIKRVLHSAVDSADKRFSIAASDLYISSIRADQGPMLKRYRAASMGRATMIKHKTTHIFLELDRIKRVEEKATREQKVIAKGQGKKPKQTKAETKKEKTKAKKSV